MHSQHSILGNKPQGTRRLFYPKLMVRGVGDVAFVRFGIVPRKHKVDLNCLFPGSGSYRGFVMNQQDR